MAAEINADVLEDYLGDYEMMPGFVLSFRRDDDRLLIQATNQPEFELTPSSDSTFFLEQFGAQITFHREPDGAVDRITLSQNGERGATRVEPFNPTLSELVMEAAAGIDGEAIHI